MTSVGPSPATAGSGRQPSINLTPGMLVLVIWSFIEKFFQIRVRSVRERRFDGYGRSSERLGKKQPTMFQPELKRRESGGSIIVKQSIINGVVMVAVGLGMSLTAQTSRAADHDMRFGTFEGNWCGFPARFELTRERGNTWVFEGKITIKATGQIDRVTVKQNRDNSLRIVRYLTGAHTGTTQWVDTYPPETLVRNDKSYVNFMVRSAGGYGSKPLGHLHMPKN